MPTIDTSSQRCHHSWLITLHDVGTFYFALFEGEDLWHHRFCFGHTLEGAVIASPEGDVYEVLRYEYTSFLLAGPRGGLLMPCVGGCSTVFVQKTWQPTHSSGTLSKGKRFFLQLPW